MTVWDGIPTVFYLSHGFGGIAVGLQFEYIDESACAQHYVHTCPAGLFLGTWQESEGAEDYVDVVLEVTLPLRHLSVAVGIAFEKCLKYLHESVGISFDKSPPHPDEKVLTFPVHVS